MSKIRIGVIPIVRGEYDAGTSYSLLNRVTSNGVMYESLVDGNVGNPLTDTSKWVRVSDNTSRVSFERVKLFDGDDTALLHYQNEINLNTEGSAGFSSFSAALAAVRTGLASLKGDKNILHVGFAFRFYNATTQRMERWQLKVNGWSNNQSDWSRVATVDDIPAGGSGGTAVTIVDNLSEGGTDAALSAEQGKNLNENAAQHDTVSFGGIVTDNVQIEMASTVGLGMVVWSDIHGTFLLRVNAKYYNNWNGRERFCAEAGGAPYAEKVYVYNGHTYVYDGMELVRTDMIGDGEVTTDKLAADAQEFITQQKTAVVDSLTSTSATSALSAKQGKALNDAKQDKLTAGAGVRISNNVISARPINAVYSMQNPTLSTMVADIMVLIQHSDVGTITVGAFASYSDGLAHEYMMQFTAGTATSLVLPASVKWAWEDVPAFTQGKTYQISIMNNLAMYAEF